MSIHQSPKVPPTGSIDFEITDFGAARQVLDDLPPGVGRAAAMEPGYWAQQRRRPVATDRALTGQAMDWVIGLPPGLRPHATCEHFPRVVNAIAGAWDDSAYSAQLLDHMIKDYRGGRRGFPLAVQQEIAALQTYQRVRSR